MTAEVFPNSGFAAAVWNGHRWVKCTTAVSVPRARSRCCASSSKGRVLPHPTRTGLPSGFPNTWGGFASSLRSEEHTSELQSRSDLVCRLLLEKKKKQIKQTQ